MKYEAINRQLFQRNRAKFTAGMQPNSLAFFNSNDVYPIGADSTLPFEQNRDFFYLCGIDQEESVLFLFPDSSQEAFREILFVRKTDAKIAVWEGAKLTKPEATEISGIKTVRWLCEMESVLEDVMAQCQRVYINTNEHPRANTETETREDRFVKKLLQKYPGHHFAKSNPILQRIRSVKEPFEIELIQKACAITEKGFRRLLDFVKPGVWEYEIEAELVHEFLRNRSKGFAYAPIVASGQNTNVLHYTANNQQCKSGDLLLLDAAAEYANYASDLTRTLPISGRYTRRQKEVYKAVHRVKTEATRLLSPGLLWKQYQKEVGKVMTSELIDLGLLDKADLQNQTADAPAYKKYFMHGTSHHLGLDTHDYGILTEPMQANMVLTVEPGIYIPEEGFGIRLEDDVVVRENGEPLNLMHDIPIEVEEIETLMNS